MRDGAPVGGRSLNDGNGAEGLEPAEAVLEADEWPYGLTHSIGPRVHNFVHNLLQGQMRSVLDQ